MAEGGRKNGSGGLWLAMRLFRVLGGRWCQWQQRVPALTAPALKQRRWFSFPRVGGKPGGQRPSVRWCLQPPKSALYFSLGRNRAVVVPQVRLSIAAPEDPFVAVDLNERRRGSSSSDGTGDALGFSCRSDDLLIHKRRFRMIHHGPTQK